MRAPGFAALALGAVVALSCTLGMSYRSDATPIEAPSTAQSTDPGSGLSDQASTPPAVPRTPAPSTSSEQDPSDDEQVPTVRIDPDAFSPGSLTAVVTASGGANATTTTISRGQPDTAFPSCSSSRCTFSGLGGGTWRIRATQTWTGEEPHTSDPTIVSVIIPAPPTITVAGDSGFRIAGTGDQNGDIIHVSLTSGAPICTSTVANGTWACSGVVAPTKFGQYSYHAFEESLGSGAESLSSDTVSFTVAPSPEPTVTPSPTSPPTVTLTPTVTPSPASTPTDTPAPDATTLAATTSPSPSPSPTASPAPITRTISLETLATWSFSVFGIDLNDVHPGDHFTVTGIQLPPGATVSGELHSVAVPVGSAVVAADGTFSLPVTVPADFAPGAHELVMTLTDSSSGVTISAKQPITVVTGGAPVASSPTSAPAVPSTGSHSSTDPLGSQAAIGGSNILTHGLTSIADVIAHPAKVPAAIEIGLVLLIFAVLPGHLLNATLADQYERFTERRSKRRRPAPGWWVSMHALLNRAPFLGGLALTTITALLFGFADPRFGFSLASLRLFLGLAIALGLVSYGTNAIVSRVMRGRWKAEVRVSLRPLGLVLTVVGVVVSRILDFSPGFLIGLVLGLVIAEKHLVQHAWRAVALRTGILLGISLLAWLAFSLFDSHTEGGTFASELAVETLVAVTTEATVALLIELLPLRLLEGQKLFEKSKLLWGVLYLVTVFIFVVAVVPWEGNWAQLGSSLWTWIGIVAGFGILATGVYIFFRIRVAEESKQIDEEELVPIALEPRER